MADELDKIANSIYPPTNPIGPPTVLHISKPRKSRGQKSQSASKPSNGPSSRRKSRKDSQVSSNSNGDLAVDYPSEESERDTQTPPQKKQKISRDAYPSVRDGPKRLVDRDGDEEMDELNAPDSHLRNVPQTSSSDISRASKGETSERRGIDSTKRSPNTVDTNKFDAKHHIDILNDRIRRLELDLAEANADRDRLRAATISADTYDHPLESLVAMNEVIMRHMAHTRYQFTRTPNGMVKIGARIYAVRRSKDGPEVVDVPPHFLPNGHKEMEALGKETANLLHYATSIRRKGLSSVVMGIQGESRDDDEIQITGEKKAPPRRPHAMHPGYPPPPTHHAHPAPYQRAYHVAPEMQHYQRERYEMDIAGDVNPYYDRRYPMAPDYYDPYYRAYPPPHHHGFGERRHSYPRHYVPGPTYSNSADPLPHVAPPEPRGFGRDHDREGRRFAGRERSGVNSQINVTERAMERVPSQHSPPPDDALAYVGHTLSNIPSVGEVVPEACSQVKTELLQRKFNTRRADEYFTKTGEEVPWTKDYLDDFVEKFEQERETAGRRLGLTWSQSKERGDRRKREEESKSKVVREEVENLLRTRKLDVRLDDEYFTRTGEEVPWSKYFEDDLPDVNGKEREVAGEKLGLSWSQKKEILTKSMPINKERLTLEAVDSNFSKSSDSSISSGSSYSSHFSSNYS